MGYLSDPDDSRWCHRHSQDVSACPGLCTHHAGELAWADPNYGMPQDPTGPAETIGVEFKSVYDANIAAGFTPPQALYILAVQMTGNPGIAPGVDLKEPEQ